MYTQSLNTREAHAAEDPVREARFQARIDAEEKIEPNDWMPEGYRKHAGPADFAARPFRNRRHAARGQLDHPRAVLKRKAALLAKVQDEGGHGALSLFGRGDAGHEP
jgi:ring-1,2-phenylacetyl-CoA epoxidase subunit PaaA